MPQSYECFTCQKVSYFLEGQDQTKCGTCGGTKIALISPEQAKEGMKRGTYSNPKAGK